LKASRERILIRLVGAISRTCHIHAARSVRHFGLTVSHGIVLGELFSHNGCRQEDLRGIVALDKGNITRAVQQLEEDGLVQRKHDPDDRRAIRVFVTKKALALEDEMYAIASQWDDQLTAGFTREERKTLINLLLRMETNAREMVKSGEVPGHNA
jgi:DNA-binding MarR family transcriptional regulator